MDLVGIPRSGIEFVFFSIDSVESQTFCIKQAEDLSAE